MYYLVTVIKDVLHNLVFFPKEGFGQADFNEASTSNESSTITTIP